MILALDRGSIVPYNSSVRADARLTEVIPINRQSYMAEVGNLLGLITDEETRKRLIAQMEQMFDAAEDEEKLIEQIGSPTKVAVALIRYADKKRTEASEQPEPVQPQGSPVTAMMEEAEANAEAPDEDVIPELAFEEAPAPAEAPAVESEVAEILLPAEEPAVEEIVEIPAEAPAAEDRKSTRLNSSHPTTSRMPSSA